MVPVNLSIEITRRQWAKDKGVSLSEILSSEIDRLMISDASGNYQPIPAEIKKKGKGKE